MIASLRGKLLTRRSDAVVVDVGGVGYLVSLSRLTLDALGAEGEPIHLQVHTHVREDAILLFGFLDEREQLAFEALIAMSGMGPKAAMGVLSGIEAAELARAVVSEDLARLCLIPGIGKKKAERMVLELKERLLPLVETTGRPDGEAGGADQILGDLRSALGNLGFKTGEIEPLLGRLRKSVAEGQDLDTLLPEALRLLRG